MNDHDSWREDIAAYALGALDVDDARQVERHLADCEECRAEFRQLSAVVNLLPLGAQQPSEPVRVPKHVKTLVMRNVRARPSFPWASYGLAAACLIAALVLGALYVSTLHTASQLSQQDREKTVALHTLLSPNASHYNVAHGQVVIKDRTVYLVMQDLQTPSSRHVYQAWTLKVGSRTMSPSLTFNSQGSVTLVKLPEKADSLAAIAVSVEPAGGSPAPTTKPIFVLKLPRATGLITELAGN